MDFDRNSMTVPVQSSDYTKKFLQKDSNPTTMEVVTQTNAVKSLSDEVVFSMSGSKCTVFARLQNVQRVQIVAKSDKGCRNSKLKTCDVSLINNVKT